MDILQDFIYNGSPGRVVFGKGKIDTLPEELRRQNLRAPLILTTPQQIDQGKRLSSILNGDVAGIFTEATMHTPTSVTDKAVSHAKSVKADSIVSIGGGSTIGLGKAISVRTDLPHICIPTTYAGSEMTPILGESVDGSKKTRSDPKILPGTVIYDVDLTMTLPTGLSATSGVNAIAHAGKTPPLVAETKLTLSQWRHYTLRTRTQSYPSLLLRELEHCQNRFPLSWNLRLMLMPVRQRSTEHGFVGCV